MITRHTKKIITFFLLFCFYGCSAGDLKPDGMMKGLTSLKHLAQGEHYLNQKKYVEGIIAFRKAIKENPDDVRLHYYLGRFYLAKNNKKQGLWHFKRAVALAPDDADYHFWLGVAYSANNKPQWERKSYVKALSLERDHVPAMSYLGNSQFEKKEYQAALKTYTRVLELEDETPQALYNRALILRIFKRTPEEINAWKAYLALYTTGSFANKATSYLNQKGDFDYRNHVIGLRTITFPKIRFIHFSEKIHKTSEPALDYLGRLVEKYSQYTLHIIAYQLNNTRLGENRSKSIKRYLLKEYPRIPSSRIKVSWFKKPETIKVGKVKFKKNQSVHFFTLRNRH